MHIEDFPYCCTAKIAAGFGESNTALGDTGEWGSVSATSQEVIEKWLKEKIASVHADHKAMLTLTTNNEQKKANKALLKLGFRHSPWVSKRQHSNTKIRLWWVDCSEWLKNNRKP